jgi:DNA-binding transcriptional LysR family regulator
MLLQINHYFFGIINNKIIVIVANRGEIETLLALSLKGMGITVYPEMFIKNLSLHLTHGADSPVDFFPLNDPETVGTLVIGYMRDKYLSNAARDFSALTRQVFKSK